MVQKKNSTRAPGSKLPWRAWQASLLDVVVLSFLLVSKVAILWCYVWTCSNSTMLYNAPTLAAVSRHLNLQNMSEVVAIPPHSHFEIFWAHRVIAYDWGDHEQIRLASQRQVWCLQTVSKLHQVASGTQDCADSCGLCISPLALHSDRTLTGMTTTVLATSFQAPVTGSHSRALCLCRLPHFIWR
jgi:hypothetical protein